MKVRTSFVTNSSSSSYLVLHEVQYDDELKAYLKEEFGKYGLRVAQENIVPGTYPLSLDLNGGNKWDYSDWAEVNDCYGLGDLDPDKFYLLASFIAWTSEGDTEGDDAWLATHIPSDKIKDIWTGESH